MQTFLPFADFAQSAAVLDYRRLGKQRLEARQILRTLEGRSRGWERHPAVRMWRGWEPALRLYYNVIVIEWVGRGYRNTMPLERVGAGGAAVAMPWWIGDERLHASHRANLKRKDAGWYAQFAEEPREGYWWPGAGQR